MSFEYSVKQGDTEPDLVATLRDEMRRKGIDLSNATRVDFIMRMVGAEDQLFQRQATVVDATTGKVKYEWQAGDTAEPALYDAEFLIVWASGDLQRVPNDDFFHVRVVANLEQ